MNKTATTGQAGPQGPVELFSGHDLNLLDKYFTDESRLRGRADGLVLPRSVTGIVAAVTEADRRNWPVTVSGARTGIAAGAVPSGGLVISLERMNRILGLRRLDDGCPALRCQAGVTLQTLQRSLRRVQFDDAGSWNRESINTLELLHDRSFFFPPDPTEVSASLGGMVACNASGAHTFRYGPVRSYVTALTVILANGDRLELSRGQVMANRDGWMSLPPDGGGSERRLQAPRYRLPQTKNAAGYYSGPDLDLVDLFIGSEGTLGIIAEVEVRLVPQPAAASANVFFLPSEQLALDLVDRLRAERQQLQLGAIEYFDANSLSFLRDYRRKLGATSGVPECLPEHADCALYVDLATEEDRLPAGIDLLRQILTAAGGDPAESWSAHDDEERERLRLFRHALPEAVNQHIGVISRQHPEVTKLGTDMAVPDDRLAEMMAMYRSCLQAAGLPHLIFGHIGDNHLHVNILPENPRQYLQGKRLYQEFARAAVAMGGSPAAEHGIGKLKKEFLALLLGDEGVKEMRRIKEFFDPDCRLGKGTLLK